MSVLIDSTLWINWFRARVDPRPHLKPWLLQGACFSCGIIRIEVLRGIADDKQRAKIERLFDAIPEIPLTEGVLRRASELAWRLDRKGKVLPLGDVVIAQCAIDSGSWLVTDDQHFSKIPGLKVRKDLPRIEK